MQPLTHHGSDHGQVECAYVATSSRTARVYFFAINIAKVPFYMEIGILTEETIQVSLWLALVIPVGVLIGRWLNQNMSDRIFYDISHLVLLGMGGRLLFRVL